MAKFKIISSNELTIPVMKGYKMACCNCSLVHNINFSIIEKFDYKPNGTFKYRIIDNKDYAIEFSATRNNRSTAQLRKHNKNENNIT